MKKVLNWLRSGFSLLLFVLFIWLAVHHKAAVYILFQAKGQLELLTGTQSIEEFSKEVNLSRLEQSNLNLVEEIKRFSVDSLGYRPTNNYVSIYNQKNKALLWVLTASQPYSLKAYEWEFPVVGKVNYKGYFNYEKAKAEYNHLVCLGYDADLRNVSAWSTLGWFSDPLLSSMLSRSKGSFCNLIFHELFHATVFKPNKVDLNENMASFVADIATKRFLKNDTAALNYYIRQRQNHDSFDKFMLREAKGLDEFYLKIANHPNRYLLKLKVFQQIGDSIRRICPVDSALYKKRKDFLLGSKNAAFIDLRQYDGLQDSLDKVFNKIYGGNIKKLVQDLRLNRIYY